MIAQKTVQEIIDAARIEEVVEDFVNLKRRGSNLIGNCPFHNEKTPSFIVSPAKNFFKCFGCGKGGTPVHFIMEHESMNFPESLRYLAKKYHIPIQEIEISPEYQVEQQLHESMYIINNFASKYFIQQLLETDEGKSIGLSYFTERGFSKITIEKFGLGYATLNQDQFTKYAVENQYNIEILRKLGLTTSNDLDFFRNRVMFPIHGISGKIVAFAGRIMSSSTKAPKYINSPESEIYVKNKILYGLYQAKSDIRKLDECFLVEGYTDVISMHQNGIENVVASSGTSLTIGQIQLIKRYTQNVVILYDGDSAGIKAALRGLDMFLEEDMNVKMVLLPDGEDPDSYLKKVGKESFLAYIKNEAKDFVLFKTDLLLNDIGNDPIKRTNVIKDIVESIAKIPDSIKRSLYIQSCSSLLNINEEILISETNKKVRSNFKKSQPNNKAEQAPSDTWPTDDYEKLVEEQIEQHSQNQLSKNNDIVSENYIAKLLVMNASMPFNDKISILEYILQNIEDIMDEIDDVVCRKIIDISLEKYSQREHLNTQYFLYHNDPEISRISAEYCAVKDDYSPNWPDDLRSQKMPDENFVHDTTYAVNFFRRRKIEKIIKKNQERIKSIENEKDLELALKVAMKLKSMHTEVSNKLNTVIT